MRSESGSLCHSACPANTSVRWCGRPTPLESRIVTSWWLGLTVEQRAKVVERGDRNPRSTFLGELLTGQRIQHPGRDGHLHVIRELDDHAISRVASKPTDDLYVFAVKRMVAVVNDGGG